MAQCTQLLLYPTSLIHALLIAVPFLMAATLGKAEVFCSSDSLLESLESASPFCTVSGRLSNWLFLRLMVTH